MFSSALAHLDTAKQDPFASYPLVQVLAAPSLPVKPASPSKVIGIAGALGASLIVLFADFSDPTGAELMIEMCGQLVRRHRVLFVVMRDEDLDRIAQSPIATPGDVARAVVAQGLIRQRALVHTRLRQAGVRVVEAPWQTIGPRLLESYLAIKREGSIG